MEITYTSIGDYLIPDVILRESEYEVNAALGIYGTLHKEYLRREKPILYASLLLSEQLYPLCREVDMAAEHRLEVIKNRKTAQEIILSELVYS